MHSPDKVPSTHCSEGRPCLYGFDVDPNACQPWMDEVWKQIQSPAFQEVSERLSAAGEQLGVEKKADDFADNAWRYRCPAQFQLSLEASIAIVRARQQQLQEIIDAEARAIIEGEFGESL